MEGSGGEPDAAQERAPIAQPRALAGPQGALLVALGRVAAGDRRALEDVYRRTAAKLLGVCLRILSERADAEEALQDTYVSIWRNAAAFDAARANPMTWLIAIARNRALDRLRARGARVTLPVEAAEALPDASADALTRLESAEDEARVIGCLGQLGAEEGRLIRTAFLEGATYGELAAQAGLPLGTVKSRIRRALLKLRACLS